MTTSDARRRVGAGPDVLPGEPCLAVFRGEPADFALNDLDVYKDGALPLDTWLPLKDLPGGGEGAFLFLRFRVDFDTTGKEVLPQPSNK